MPSIMRLVCRIEDNNWYVNKFNNLYIIIVYGVVVILMFCCKVFHAVSMNNCLLENIST